MVAPAAWQLDVWSLQKALPAQANCPFSCCIDPGQSQTISHLFITCPVAATVTDWLCRLWQAMTGYLPVVSVTSLLAADLHSEQLPSDALFQTWHRLRLAALHSIWAASQIAQASRSTQPSDALEPDAIMTSSPSSQQPLVSSSTTSHHGHLARQLALKTVKAMIRHDWTKFNDHIKQISGVCSSWLRGKDPNITLAASALTWSHLPLFLPCTVTHMCQEMTSLAIMAGRLGAKTFWLPLAGIACHGLIA